MSEYLYLDIETIPSQDPETLAAFKDAVTAPATYKKQESIDAWILENRETAALDALAKTSFDPAHGHVCTISWAVGDGDIQACHAETVKDEAKVLAAFFEHVDEYHSQIFVGHFINGFDLRFLLCRAVILGVKIPRGIPRDPKPWDKKINDTMTMWAGSKGKISLGNLSKALGIEGKGGFDGSQVAGAWARGDHDTIAEYCMDDVRIVRDVHRKFMAANF
jgi:DNA polymerase elongation subunit (family B)